MKLDRWSFTRIIADPHLCPTPAHTQGSIVSFFSLLDFIQLCPYYWMEMTSILGNFFLAFAFALLHGVVL